LILKDLIACEGEFVNVCNDAQVRPMLVSEIKDGYQHSLFDLTDDQLHELCFLPLHEVVVKKKLPWSRSLVNQGDSQNNPHIHFKVSYKGKSPLPEWITTILYARTVIRKEEKKKIKAALDSDRSQLSGLESNTCS